MSFFSSLKRSYKSGREAPRRNSFESRIHTPPPKRTPKDRELEKIKRPNNDDIFEVLADDEETQDMERLVKDYGTSYSNQQKNFRKAVLEKYETEDGYYICAHCGRKFKASGVQADHLIPRSLGGSFSIINGQILCNFCNHSKNDDISDADEDFERIQKQDQQAKEDDKEFLKIVSKMLESGDIDDLDIDDL